MNEVMIRTKKAKEVVDITDLVESEIQKAGSKDVLVHLFLTHTTAALTTADLDPGTDLDMIDAFEAMIPKLKYRHPHNPSHVSDHILSSIIGTSLTLPIENGKLLLGQWQRVVLVEFNGPRERRLVISFIAGR